MTIRFEDDHIYFAEGYIRTSDYLRARFGNLRSNPENGLAVTNLINLGTGPDGETLSLEKVNEGTWVIHCPGNSESPFEFSSELDARQFADILTMERIGEL